MMAAQRLVTDGDGEKACETIGFVVAGRLEIAPQRLGAHVDAEDRLGLWSDCALEFRLAWPRRGWNGVPKENPSPVRSRVEASRAIAPGSPSRMLSAIPGHARFRGKRRSIATAAGGLPRGFAPAEPAPTPARARGRSSAMPRRRARDSPALSRRGFSASRASAPRPKRRRRCRRCRVFGCRRFARARARTTSAPRDTARDRWGKPSASRIRFDRRAT